MTLNFSYSICMIWNSRIWKDFTEEFPEFMTDLNNDEIINTLKNTVYQEILKKLGI